MPRFPLIAGDYAEYVTAPSRQLARKPATLSHEQAAAVHPVALTTWQALVDTAKLLQGQRLLVHATAGGVGHFAVQIAKHLGREVRLRAVAEYFGFAPVDLGPLTMGRLMQADGPLTGLHAVREDVPHPVSLS